MIKASSATTRQPATGPIRCTVNIGEGYARFKAGSYLYKAAFCSSYTSPQQWPNGSVRAAQQQRSDSATTAQQQHNSTFTAP
ncbi:MAG: hypothetical protein EOP56_10415 [Sphingobacteriales bacterium]|nr:MAG: hypothetical protein EOP56_10415 [Sphingobacteriales bacterium]